MSVLRTVCPLSSLCSVLSHTHTIALRPDIEKSSSGKCWMKWGAVNGPALILGCLASVSVWLWLNDYILCCTVLSQLGGLSSGWYLCQWCRVAWGDYCFGLWLSHDMCSTIIWAWCGSMCLGWQTQSWSCAQIWCTAETGGILQVARLCCLGFTAPSWGQRQTVHCSCSQPGGLIPMSVLYREKWHGYLITCMP